MDLGATPLTARIAGPIISPRLQNRGMKPGSHPDYKKLVEGLRALRGLAAPYSATLYRCVETAFAHDFGSGKGAQFHGGRWNPKGAFPAVYLCDSPETALAEYLARVRRMRLPDARALPMVMAAVETRVTSALVNWEQGEPVSAVYAARGRELQSLYQQLASLMKPEEVGAWLNTEMEEFDGRSPADLVRHGETGRIWESIYFLRSGQPD